MDKVSDTPNQDEVICPACSHQFRAIPENVQSELAAQKEQLRLCNVDQFSTAAELAALKEQYRVLEDEMLVMMDERNAAVARSNLLACALRALLSKCPDCGGTGEVGNGIIQMGQPAQMSCFVCAGERQILLKECGK
jgi:hypothetical protein